jgi:hypothetical protein
VLSRLALPPGYRLQIDYDPDVGPMNTTLTVRRGAEWIGEITVPVSRLDHPDDVQDIVDMLTKRGPRLAKEG